MMNIASKLAPLGIERLTFGMVPITDDAQTRVYLSDLCAVLARKLDVAVVPHRAPSPAALASAIQAGRVHLAWLSPTLMVTSPSLASIIPLVSSVRQGTAVYHAVLFVPETSAVQRPDQLRGARAAWVAPTSASGYLFSRLALGRRGLHPSVLFSAETFYDSHGRVAEAVLDGDADVGATFAVYEGGDPQRSLVRAGFLDVVPGRTCRIIDVAGPIPADLVAAVPSIPILARSAITVALQRIAEDPAAKAPLRVLFGVETFQPFSSNSLPALRALVEASSDTGPKSTRYQPILPRNKRAP